MTGELPATGDRGVRGWDCVALGEVMLRLDPGNVPVRTARAFQVWEGGGEYNVARALRRVFGLRTAVVTALVDNEVGRLLEDLLLQGGVDSANVVWVPFDGVGRQARNALNFTDRGFGVRAARGCSDRGHSAASLMRPGDVDWETVFAGGARWFHTGGIFAALGEHTPDLVLEGARAAKAAGATVSYDLNYRASLWQGLGGQARAREVNRAIAPFVDVMIGNEEDFTAALGYEVEGSSQDYASIDHHAYESMIRRVAADHPGMSMVATTLRTVRSATINGWSAVLFADGRFHYATERQDLEVFDRVGGGDGFASGLVYGLLSGLPAQQCVELGAAHGALAMTTPGDTSMVTLDEVERVARGGSARVAR
jgi:2-dehydro-3-deoxygluconokinase